MSVGTIYIATRGFVFNNSVGSVNLFPWVHHETIQRGQLSRKTLGRNEICLCGYSFPLNYFSVVFRGGFASNWF